MDDLEKVGPKYQLDINSTVYEQAPAAPCAHQRTPSPSHQQFPAPASHTSRCLPVQTASRDRRRRQEHHGRVASGAVSRCHPGPPRHRIPCGPSSEPQRLGTPYAYHVGPPPLDCAPWCAGLRTPWHSHRRRLCSCFLPLIMGPSPDAVPQSLLLTQPITPPKATSPLSRIPSSPALLTTPPPPSCPGGNALTQPKRDLPAAPSRRHTTAPRPHRSARDSGDGLRPESS